MPGLKTHVFVGPFKVTINNSIVTLRISRLKINTRGQGENILHPEDMFRLSIGSFKNQPIASGILTQPKRYKRAESKLPADKKGPQQKGPGSCLVIHLYICIHR